MRFVIDVSRLGCIVECAQKYIDLCENEGRPLSLADGTCCDVLPSDADSKLSASMETIAGCLR